MAVSWVNDFDDVVDILSPKGVASVCGISQSRLSEWRSGRGQFEARCEDAINNELHDGYECMAHSDLFHRVNGAPAQPIRKPRPRWTEELRRAALRRVRKK